jgi:sulfide dehydrogenase [flavocytochrome c] flavoprotein subunit
MAIPDTTRRRLLKLVGGSSALALMGVPIMSRASFKARVVIVGGGYGGATVAKYVRLTDPRIEVVLIEKKPKFISCALSNEVISGERSIESLTFAYTDLVNLYGVKVVHDEVVEIDPANKVVSTKSGKKLGYDRLVVAPGIGFRWDAIEGYGPTAAQVMPHAWSAGEQTLLLRQQIEAMPDGGTLIIVAPPNPYRCPPGPYERASLIAHYLKTHGKGRSKILILDAKDKFAKQPLFAQGWRDFYPGMISWVSRSQDGRVLRVDPQSKSVFTEFEQHKGDVVNVVPPQKAGPIAEIASLTDENGWCPVDQRTFESSLHKDVHVIGDACIAGPMPKSAYAANTQAKVCAAAIVALVNGTSPREPSYVNACYSIIAPDYGISMTAVYRLKDGKIVSVKGAGGTSPIDASRWERKMEATYARSWFTNITSDIFG